MMDGEQTWPTNEELQEAEDEATKILNKKKKLRKVPKGTSDYQAAWILNDDNDEENDELKDDSEDDDMIHEDLEAESEVIFNSFLDFTGKFMAIFVLFKKESNSLQNPLINLHSKYYLTNFNSQTI